MNRQLAISHLCFSYRPEEEIFHHLNLSIPFGKFLGIIGPNGGGKSTLFKLMMGELIPEHGMITIDGRSISEQKERIAYLPQDYRWNQFLPVRVDEFVLLGRFQRTSPHALEEVLEWVEMKEFKKAQLSKLSGGQKQRILLAKTLISGADYLFLDEPLTGLDRQAQDSFFQILKNLTQTQNKTILMVDHHLNQLIPQVDQIICLNRSLHWHDERELFDRKILEEIYCCEFEYGMDKIVRGQHDH